MAKIYIKSYDRFTLTGSDFAPISGTQLRRVVFSPDDRHSISIVSLKDGALLITNENGIEFEFSISRNRRVLAVVHYRPNDSSLHINNNWILTQQAIRNRAINENPDLVHSQNFNIDFGGSALARIDLKINDAFPRISDHITHAAALLPVTEAQVSTFLNENPAFTARLPVTEAQVSTFLNENPGFTEQLPLTEAQVSKFLEDNSHVANNFGKLFFKRLMQENQWFSN